MPSLWLAALAASAAAGAADVGDPRVPFPPFEGAAPPPRPRLSFLSATLGGHMVLQRAPRSATVWGHTAAGASVATTFDGKTYTATAGADGVWRQQLPPTPASKRAYALAFRSSAGENATLSDVLFGDVYICGGQSNMQFAMPAVANASLEQQLANNYPNIRLFTVGTKTQSETPLGDLQTIEQPWAVASSESISGDGEFGYFSAVCLFFGRQISDALSPSHGVPLGLISNNWGGTPVESWSPPDAYRACNRTGVANLYNAMINPYTVGPMAVSGFTWYQGEANTASAQSAKDYSCLFPAMISGWRKAFGDPSAYFGFVQLSTWCGDPLAIAEMRDAQMAALALAKVGYATNADHGAGCDIHPPPKQYCGERLGNSALALQYARGVAWRSPEYDGVRTARATASAVSVTVGLLHVSAAGLRTDVASFNYVEGLNCTALDAKTPGTCAWASIQVAAPGGQALVRWLNAMVSVAPGGQVLVLEASGSGLEGAAVVATSYGYGAIPLMNAYDRGTGLPVLPWSRTLRPPVGALLVV